MFQIDLELEDKSLTGLAALDERRRLGLPDDSRLYRAGSELGGATSYHAVPESFARAHFGRTETSRSAEVPWELLTPADVYVTEVGYLKFRADPPAATNSSRTRAVGRSSRE